MRALSVALVLLAACNPYEKRSGEYYAGPLPSTEFRDGYRGTLRPVAATAHGVAAAYYAFPLATTAPPTAHVFDARCEAPAGWTYDAALDPYRLDQQYPVFSALATAPGVMEAPVTSNGEGCQSIKSETTLLGAGDVVAHPLDGTLLAWALVDPAADVDASVLRLGWLDHQLVGYIDGGALPMTGSGAVVQNVTVGADGSVQVDAVRGEPGYSPLCKNANGMTFWCLQP